MRIPSLKPALLCLALLMTSCSEEEKKSKKESRLDQDNYFSGVEMGGALNSLKNELADDHTDFLRSFGQDEIPWQKWDLSLLEKAKSAQRPILLFVGSSHGEASRKVGHELSENPVLREMLTNLAVCTMVDTHAHPEIKLLCYQLSIERKVEISFPFLIWLSHEGTPLATLPLGSRSGRNLEVTLGNSAALIDEFWTKSSNRTIEQSHATNTIRQAALDTALSKDQETIEREETFRSSTRYLSSLYSFGDQDLDDIGGLIPTKSLELLALGANSHLFTDQIRARCRNAASEVARSIIEGAIKDHLDGSFFFARRTSDWSLPSFAKNISSQAKIAHMLIRVGTLLDEELFLEEGLSALSVIEESWLPQSLSSITLSDSPDEAGKFLWDIETLKQTLTEEELSLALAAFSMTPNGNIPPAVDPLENYYHLNSLRRTTPISELAHQRGQSEPQLVADLNIVKGKLLKQREKNTQYLKESSYSATDLALLLKAQLARVGVGHLPETQSLQSASALADRIIKEFYDPEKGLVRLPSSQNPLPARCQDYANTANAFFLFYQATLEEKWLTFALNILDEAMVKLASENGLLSETSESERIIPLRQHNCSMIFGDSSIGILDISLNRAWAITGDEKYQKMLSLHTKRLTAFAKKSPVNHTDYISSCALGTHPLVAILNGNPNEENGRQLLISLNSQKHLPYLTIRAAKPSDPQPELSGPESRASVTLMRNGQILGTATQVDHLEKTLNKIIAGN